MAMDEVRVAMVNQAFVPPGMEIGQTGAHLPALGLLMLASAIEECDASMKGKIAYFDEEQLGLDSCRFEVVKFLSGAKTGIVMLTTYTMTHHRQIEFFEEMKRHDILTIAGGPHVTIHPETSNADYVVRGEGVSAMRAIFPWKGSMPEVAPGMIKLTKNPSESETKLIRVQRKLDPLMWPEPSFAYHLLPTDICHRASHKRNLANLRPMSILLSKGCPSACHFCTSGSQNGRWGVAPIKRFENDLRHLLDHHEVEAIEFHDDDLLAHPDIHELLAVVGNTNIPWTCYARVNALVGPRGPAMAEAIAKAGCVRVFLGLEAMDNERLAFLGKQASVEDNFTAVSNLHEAGVEVAGAWIIGLPDDCTDALNVELERFLSLPLYSLDINILNLNPGASLTKKVVNGKIPLPGGMKISKAVELLPDPSLFGKEEPFGQPTISMNLTKNELNDYAKAARRRTLLAGIGTARD